MRKYLEGYSEKFLGNNAEWRLSSKVERLAKVGDSWEVQVLKDGHSTTETFDGLVFAGGFFMDREIPNIPGLDNSNIQWTHAELVHDWLDQAKKEAKKRKILVVGGSFSSAEVVSELALQNKPDWEVIHVHPRPFYTLPRFLPRLTGDNASAPEFWPLDFVLYDQSRTKDPSLSELEVLRKKHEFLSSVTSRNIGELSAMEQEDLEAAPWVVVSEWYQQLAREKKFQSLRGYVKYAKSSNSVVVSTPKGVIALQDVTDIVFATGYSPRKELAEVISPDLLTALSFDPSDSHLPIPLYHHQLHPALGSNCGFVGMYKGPYFGVIEAQARYIADILAGSTRFPTSEELNSEISTLISTRNSRSNPALRRQTPPFSEYTTFMNTLPRTTPDPLSKDLDPLLPALYSPDASSPDTQTQLTELRALLSDPTTFIAPAVFRALHGKWKISRTITSHNVHQFSGNLVGTAEFTPRPHTGEEGSAPACPVPGAAKAELPPSAEFKATTETPELVYTESGTFHTLASPASAALTFTAHKCYLYRLVPNTPPTLSAYFLAPGTHPATALTASLEGHFHELTFERKDGKWTATGKHWCAPDWYDARYEFEFDGCELKAWELEYVVKGPKKDYVSLTRYSGPQRA